MDKSSMSTPLVAEAENHDTVWSPEMDLFVILIHRQAHSKKKLRRLADKVESLPLAQI